MSLLFWGGVILLAIWLIGLLDGAGREERKQIEQWRKEREEAKKFWDTTKAN